MGQGYLKNNRVRKRKQQPFLLILQLVMAVLAGGRGLTSVVLNKQKSKAKHWKKSLQIDMASVLQVVACAYHDVYKRLVLANADFIKVIFHI